MFEPPRPARWWRVVTGGPQLPPEPPGGFPRVQAPAGARNEDPAARGPEGQGALPPPLRGSPEWEAHPEVAIEGQPQE